MTEERVEYSRHFSISTGIPGEAQESSFMNATLQDAGDLDFSVAVHVAVPTEIETENALREYLHTVFADALDVTDRYYGRGTVEVEIQIGLGRGSLTERG